MPHKSTFDHLKAALADRYEVLRDIGQGGMATVYLARDLRHNRNVAVKVLSPETGIAINPERFQAEIRTAARLQHPHIIPLFDSGEADGLLYYTMPYVEGVTLQDRLRSGGPLGLEEFLTITREVADGLAYAHRQGLVHRDVKPSNILLSSGHAALADFGLVRAIGGGGDALTRTGTFLGTSLYMSPEQASTDEVDSRADLYSMACVCFEMLTGEPPYRGPNFLAILASHATAEIPSVRKTRPDVPVRVEAAIARAMAKAPSDRFQSVEEFLAALPRTAAEARGEGSTGWTGSSPPRSARIVRIITVPTLLVALAVVLYGAYVRFGPRGAGEVVPRLVVLPFDNRGSAEYQSITDGITEELTGRLGTVGSLAVIGRASALQYRDTDKPLEQIARELGVAYVLGGSVQWSVAEGSEPMLRVSSSLIDANDGKQLWFDAFDAQLGDVFSVQSSIAQRVVAALDLILGESQRRRLDKAPTTDAQAYRLYMQGNTYYNRSWAESDVQTALDFYDQAVGRDSAFALAWASLGRTHAWMYQLRYDRNPQRLEDARFAADRALSLDPDLPEAHVAQGYYYYWGQRDYATALEHFERAVQLNPSDAVAVNAIANIRRRQGEFAAALTSYRRSTELDPMQSVAWYNLGSTLLFVRQFEEADSALERAISLAPDLSDAYLAKMRLAVGRGADLDSVRVILARADAEVGVPRWRSTPRQIFQIVYEPAEALARLRLGDYGLDSTGYHFAMGQALERLADRDSARVHWDAARVQMEQELAADPEQHWTYSELGVVYAWLGRRDEAVRAGERAVDLLPVSKDAVDAPEYLVNLAWIHTILGERDRALDYIEQALSIPSWLTRGLLKSEPRWAPLRDHPRYRALIAGDEVRVGGGLPPRQESVLALRR